MPEWQPKFLETRQSPTLAKRTLTVDAKTLTDSSVVYSIIVPVHNEARFLPGLLDSIARYLREPHEIIVVDNGSTDGSVGVARRRSCHVIALKNRVYPSVARNAGRLEASGAILIFLDGDVEITERWAAELQSQRSKLGSRAMVVTGDRYHISQSPTALEKLWFGPLRANVPTYINGGNLIVTGDAFDYVGGFDENLETGEDVDFCSRARAAGAKLIVNTGFVALHEGYPKSLTEFIRRERWHGLGDFSSLTAAVHSRVAIATIVFLALHFALGIELALIPFGIVSIWGVSTAAFSILALCSATSFVRFRKAGLLRALKTIPISYFYFIGRALSVITVMVRGAGNRRRHC